MTEQSELLERLQDLQRLSREKKYNLVKAEQEEALSVLLKLYAESEKNYRVILKGLPDLPSDVGATFLAKEWGALAGAGSSIFFDLTLNKFATNFGRCLRIALAQRLLNSDPVSSSRLLLDAFREMKSEKAPMPNLKGLGIIRSALVEPAGRSIEQLPIKDTKSPDWHILPTYILTAAFVNDKKHKKALPVETQLAIIRWANGFPELPQLPQEAGNAVVQAIKTWDVDLRRILAPEIRKDDASLQKLLLPVCPEAVSAEPPMDSSKIPSPSTPDAAPAVQSVEPDQPYDALKELKRLSYYVRGLQSQLKQSQQKTHEVDLQMQQTMRDLGAARRESQKANDQLHSKRETAKRLKEEMEVLAREAATLRTDIQRLNQELDDAKLCHKKMKASLTEQLDEMSERIASEGEHRLSSFRNKLSEKLQVYADGLNEAKDMEMTIELGEALRNQMAQLLHLLKMEGFRNGGGK